ncbi:SOS response-associated peptidase [Methanofollis fontis]|uniref:DUF159 family protein n=1 Tax=Methanofollis fontis TaxID=2052832 RepID=A0A483CT64_9EURY|nr:SOS response-associated peptidase [Methanofollis fontis]TAJ43864.1 DUF159 family protein [Methanofollis fontis]
MCGRYTIAAVAGIGERFGVSSHPAWLRPRYNAAPSQRLPVVCGDGERQVCPAVWGMGEGGKIINARAGSMHERPLFSSLLKGGRCLVPADGFYEWDRMKRPYYFTLPDSPLFAFAGLVSEERQFVILTTESNAVVAPVHGRMPVILRREDEGRWLSGADAEEVCTPYPAAGMERRRVGSGVSDPANDDPSLILSPEGAREWW